MTPVPERSPAATPSPTDLARAATVDGPVSRAAGTRGFAVLDREGSVLTGAEGTALWTAGMRRTLARLVPAAGHVIVLADTPRSRLADPGRCLERNPSSTLACATSVARAVNEAWLAAEREVAAMEGATFIDPQRWICPTSPCPAVIGSHVVFRNRGHPATGFAATLWRRLGDALPDLPGERPSRD